LRLLVVLFAAEFSGAVHTALDVAAALGVMEHPDDGCDSDEQDHDCPPGCPSCHCAHGALAWTPPRSELRRGAVHPPVEAASFVPCESVPAQGAVLTPPDRPPRIAVLS
jgi:hypothetical protein